MQEIRDKIIANTKVVTEAFIKPFDKSEIEEVRDKLQNLVILQDTISTLVTMAWGYYAEIENNFYLSLSDEQHKLKADHLKALKNKYCKEAKQLLMKSEHIQKDNHYAIEGLRSILSDLKDERRNIISNG